MQNVTLVEGVPDTLTLFDGNWEESPLRVPDDCVVRYIQACNAVNGYVCGRGTGSHIEFCEFWNDTPPQGFVLPQNCHVFSADTLVGSSSNKTTSNEVATFGMARKTYQNFQCEWIDDNHLWARFDGITKDQTTAPGEPLETPSGITSMACAAQYLSGNVIVRNSIFTTGSNVDLRAAEGRPVRTQIIGSDAPHLTMGVEYINILAMAPRQIQPPKAGLSFMKISKIWRLSAMDTVLDNCHAVGYGRGINHKDAPSDEDRLYGVQGWELGAPVNPPKTGIYRNCWSSTGFFNRIRDPWVQEGDFTRGVAPHLWPTLSDAQWRRIQRATRWSTWDEAVKPGDQLVIDQATNWDESSFHQHVRKAYSFPKPLISNDE
jgi:hypothetical protein